LPWKLNLQKRRKAKSSEEEASSRGNANGRVRKGNWEGKGELKQHIGGGSRAMKTETPSTPRQSGA